MISRLWLAAIPLGLAAFFLVGPADAQPVGPVPEWSLAAQQRLLGGPDAERTLALQRQLVQDAERVLAAGDAATALQTFDRAALMVHAPEVEMGLVRADMQLGNYRRALSFAAHAAGAHRNVPAGAALYAWLLHIGGQGVYARRLLGDALERSPDDALLQAVRVQFDQPWPQPQPVLLQPPVRVAPQASGAQPPPAARLAGTALLVADGRSALVPALSVPPGARLWLRNGLGQTVEAVAALSISDPRLLRLQLREPLPGVPGLTTSARAPFAGSPGVTVEYGASAGTQATWPLLRQGFFGRHLAAGAGERLLGIDAPAGPRGGPVFDAFGDLAGIAVPMADGLDRLIAAATLLAELGLQPPQTPSPSPQPAPRERAPLDGLYEVALHLSLQLLVAD